MLRLKVKEIAEQRGFSPQALAKASGLSYRTIARLLHDPYCYWVTTVTIGKLALALGVTSHDLLEELPDPENQLS